MYHLCRTALSIISEDDDYLQSPCSEKCQLEKNNIPNTVIWLQNPTNNLEPQASGDPTKQKMKALQVILPLLCNTHTHYILT